MGISEENRVFELRGQGKSRTAFFSGQWVHSPSVECTIPDGTESISLDISGVTQWDSTFVAQVYKLKRLCEKSKLELDTSSLPEGAANLLALAMAVPPRKEVPLRKQGILERIGRSSVDIVSATNTGLSFTGALAVALVRACLGRARIRWRDIVTQLYKAGPDALFIVSLIGFLVGVILAFIGSIPLKWFGAEIYVASFLGIGLLRLLGAVMAGAVMAGRTGAAFAAELGTMQVNEEIDAMETMGISPMEFLVLPRFIGLTIMMPFICIFTNAFGIIGGIFVSTVYLEISPTEFWDVMIETTRLCDMLIGTITSFVFGILIAVCGCLRGLRCGRSSEAVGQATTSAMVSCIITMVLATFIITVVTVALGY